MVDVAANPRSAMVQHPTRVTGAGDETNPYLCSISYQYQWRAHLQQQQGSASLDSTIVYDCCCVQLNHPCIAENDVGAWALACTSQGLVYAWMIPSSVASGSINDSEDLLDDEWDLPDNSTSRPSSPGSKQSPTKSLVFATHQWLVNPYRSALYKLKVVTIANASASTETGGTSESGKVLLFVAGEGCGVLAYDVGQLLSFDAHSVSPTTHVYPLLRYEPYPNPYRTPAIIDFDVNVEANTVTAIANDEWGLYQWRLDTTHRIPLQIPQRRIEDGPITCFCSVSGPKDQGTSTLVGTGSGILYRLSNRPDDEDAMATDDENGTQAPVEPYGPTKLNVRTLLQLPGATISQVVQVNDCWWTVVGATTKGVGYVATIHAPTQSVVHSVNIRGKPQKVLHCPHRHSLVVMNNSPVVEHLQAISLEVTEKMWTSLKSCHGMTTMAPAATSASTADPNTELTVVCGAGKQLDVYRGPTRVMALATST